MHSAKSGSTHAVVVCLTLVLGGCASYHYDPATPAGPDPTPPALTSPASGSKPGGSTVFAWSPGSGSTLFQLRISSVSPGQSDVYASGQLPSTVTSETINVPSDGAKLYVRLYYYGSGTWNYIDYSFVDAGQTLSPPALTSPVSGSRLGGSTVFAWSPGAGSTSFQLNISSVSPGQSDIYASGQLAGTVTSETVNIPSGGANLYVRLYYSFSGTWNHIDYTFMEAAALVPPALTSPASGSKLSGSMVFAWSPGAGSTSFQLNISSVSSGQSDIYASGQLACTVTSETVKIPSDGAKLYVRLSYFVNGKWNFIDYTFMEAAAPVPPALTSPASGSRPGGSTVFAWSPGAGSTLFRLDISSVSPGQTEIYASGQIASSLTSETVYIPSNGVNLYVRLYYYLNGNWSHIDYTFVEAGTPTPPALIRPASGSHPGGVTAFLWNPGAGSTLFQLHISSISPGQSDIYSSGQVAGTLTLETVDIPSEGADLYVRLYYCINGSWRYIDYNFVEATPGITSLNHIVFTEQENHSFDQYFGALRDYWAKNGYPDESLDGLPQFNPVTGAAPLYGPPPTNPGCNPDSPPPGPCVFDPENPVTSFHLQTMCTTNPIPGWDEYHIDWDFHDPLGFKPAALNGFVQPAAKRGNAGVDVNGVSVMGYYDGDDLNYYYFMASNFATSDRWFTPLMSRTGPSHSYLNAATSQGYVYPTGTNSKDQKLLTATTIFQELQRAGISWKIYVNTAESSCTGPPYDPACLVSLSYIKSFAWAKTLAADYPQNIAPLTQYFTDAQNGTLPQVAEIEPPFHVPFDEHPNGDNPQKGMQYISTLINGLMQSPSWKDSVFVLSYDEAGGFYDHVSPQPEPSPDGIKPLDLLPGQLCATSTGPTCDFVDSGYRVPLIVVSPFTKKHYVSHTVADSTAILKLIETRFDLSPLTKRDAAQMDMSEFFSFEDPPWETPPTPPEQNTNGLCDQHLLP